MFLTLQVWNGERAMLLRTFEEEHEEQVNHCQFTNTSGRLLLATCSNDDIQNVKVCLIYAFDLVFKLLTFCVLLPSIHLLIFIVYPVQSLICVRTQLS